MYIEHFELKQHTPLIHFQAEDEGATLRATEVKPKLDKFLIKKLENIPKAWISREEDKEIALDYGLSFMAYDVERIDIEKHHRSAPMYFGNMGDGEVKALVIAKGGVKGKLKVRNSSLAKKIIEILPEFFMLHNFGTRQSKGYGSFTVEDNKKSPNPYKYQFTVEGLKNDIEKDFEKIMSSISWFYQSLRSGFNLNIEENKIYMKPAIFHYLNNKGIVWDKKSIKETFFDNQSSQNRNNYKDLMGLSTSEKWGRNFTITKEDVQGEVTRYKSPILFKPIYNGKSATIFFDYFEPDYIQDFLGTEFKVKANGRGNLILTVPKEFDFEDFLKFSFQMDMNSVIEGGDNGKPRYIKNSLTQIYAQLKTQVK